MAFSVSKDPDLIQEKQHDFSGSKNESDNLESGFQQKKNDERLPLKTEVLPPVKYPFEALGSILGEAAQSVHRIIQAPDSICAQSFLGAASLIAQPHVDIEIDGRTFPVSLYLISIAESGDRKTAVDNIAMHPVRGYEKMLLDCFKDDKRRYRNAHDIWNRQIEAALKGENAEKLLDELGDAPDQPLEPIILCEEPSYEGLVHMLNIGQPNMGLFSDEGGRMIGGYGLNEENILKTVCGLSNLWDGKPITRVRKGDESLVLHGRRLAAHLLMQGVVFEKIQANRIFTEQGFLSRCLVARPCSLVGNREYQEENPFIDPAISKYFGVADALLDRPHSKREGSRSELTPRRLILSSKAKSLWKELQKNTEVEMKPDGKYRSIVGLANKMPDMCLRIAGTLAFFEYPELCEIPIAILERALTLATWYLDEAVRIFEIGESDREMDSIQKKLDWMQEQAKKGINEFPASLLCQRAPRPRSAKAVKKAMKIMEDYGHVLVLQKNVWGLKR